MRVDPARAKVLFLAALELTEPFQRLAFLDRETAGNPGLRTRVLGLLDAHDRPPPRLDRMLAERAPDPDATAFCEDRSGAGLEDIVAMDALVAGRYKVREAIGEGGMGVVYLADQVAPVRRRVALKLVKAGMDSRSVLARFEAERQALAMMDHPHVARVLDAGTTDRGRPFFVMELVKGVAITEFCDAHRLDVASRLALFRQVCAAVHHAHQKGIIHRDLKPGNILVEDHDGTPVPKVIDFGLAKAMGGEVLTERTVYTGFGAITGTPLYMAPEQATFSALDVDTRADIYALGVICYELLTGTTPIPREALKSTALDELLRAVREAEPPTPSSRLSSTSERASVAAARLAEPARLGRLVRGDLDWIVMKALAKERHRRYESAAALADDVGRFLALEPVSAGPPGAGYRARKFVRRNRPAVLAASVAIAALSLGAAGATAGFFRARHQERRAENAAAAATDAQRAEAAQRAQAEGKAAEAEAVIRFLQERVFAAARPRGQDGGLGRDVTLREAIDAAEPAIGVGLEGQPLVEARLRATLGTTYGDLGRLDAAIVQFERARALEASRLGPDHPDTLAIAGRLATAFSAAGRRDEARALRERMYAGLQRAAGPDRPETIAALADLADSFAETDRGAAACRIREDVLARSRRLLGPDHPDTLVAMSKLARCHAGAREADARTLREAVLGARRRVLGPEHPETLRSMGDLADSDAALNRPGEALALREEAAAASKRVLGPDHLDTLKALGRLAESYDAQGRLDEVIRVRREEMDGRRRAYPAHPSTQEALRGLAGLLVKAGRGDEVLSFWEQAVAWQRPLLGERHPNTLDSLGGLADAAAAAGRHEESLKVRLVELAGRRGVFPQESRTAVAAWRAAEELHHLGRDAEAIPLVDEYLRGPAGRPAARWWPASRVVARARDDRHAPAACDLRLRHFQRVGDAEGCRDTAELWEKLGNVDAPGLYRTARLRAAAAAMYGRSGRPREAGAEADRAMSFLIWSSSIRPLDRAQVEGDVDLESLRDRADYREFLATLSPTAPVSR